MSAAISTPDANIARKLAAKLAKYRTGEAAKHFTELGQRAHQLEQSLQQRLEIVAKPNPCVAFVANKGVGKSTLINALAGLWIDGAPPPSDATSKVLNQCAILPLGSGGTTPCEIRIEAGEWEVRVEAEDLAETHASLRQFAEWAWHKAQDSKGKAADSAPDGLEQAGAVRARPPRLQIEVERVLRGMTGLLERAVSAASPSGSTRKRAPAKRADDAEGLGMNAATPEALIAEFERLARLPERKQLQWLPTGDPRRWLQKTLLDLFEGKFHAQPFPRLIVVRTPSTGVQWDQSTLPLIDTLGLPAVSAGRGEAEPDSPPRHPLTEREDLRALLKAPWTLVVVACQLHDPPTPSVELLKQMMEEGVFFGETLEIRTLIAIVDDGKSGASHFNDAESERAKKEDRCAENVVLLGCPHGLDHPTKWTFSEARSRVFCVNAIDGGTELLQDALHDAFARMKSGHAEQLAFAVAAAESFFLHLGDAKRNAIRGAVVSRFRLRLTAIAQRQKGKARAFRASLLQPFADACRELHPSTLRSVIVHRGSGRTRSAWAILESATTRELERILGPLISDMEVEATALLGDEKYQDDDGSAVIAEELDRRTRIMTTFLRAFVEQFIDLVRDLLQGDPVWRACEAEWGLGIPGYKERVAQRLQQWGVDHSPELETQHEDVTDQVKADDTGLLVSLTEG
ncbi:MAG: hypothetical protein RL685_584 [Pseudomonadota bacterium]